MKVKTGKDTFLNIQFGQGPTKYGPGVDIDLDEAEVALAIIHWLHGQGVYIVGSRTVTIGGVLCSPAKVYVDPGGYVMHEGRRYSGRGPGHSSDGV